MKRLVVTGAAFIASQAGAETPAIPQFLPETEAGIATAYEGEWEYMVGGGVAVFDCNADGYPDAFVAGGVGAAGMYRNVSGRGESLRFVPVEGSGVELDAVTGAYPLDIDGDGIMDLVLLRVGENVVMRGTGDCGFVRANEDWGFDGGDGWSTAFAAIWEDGAAWPTLAIGNYIDRYEDAFPWGSCTDSWLHRGDDTGFAAPLALTPSHCALSMLFTDWKRSGRPDLRVSNDREYYKGGEEQLWALAPGTAPRLYTAEDGWERLRIWGMGIAGYDLDFDGYPEYFLTSMADNKLQRLRSAGNDALPVYADIAFASGVTAHRPHTGDDLQPSTAWHAQFDDVNNDGLVDLFVAKGNVAEMPDFAMNDPHNLLLQNADGTFHEAAATAGVASFATGRGAALADFNLDGALDLMVVNRWQAPEIWRNTGDAGGNRLQVRLHQEGPNRDAIGSWIELRMGDHVLRREVTSGGGHASGQSGWWHFGLAARDVVDLRVIWPDGTESSWMPLAANGFFDISRDGAAEPWEPRATATRP